MAALPIVAQTGEIATGTALKTLLQLVAPANQRVRIKEVSVSFKGIANTDAPVLVEVVTQTDAGTMSALTIQKWDQDLPETVQSTAQSTATAEPTLGVALVREEVHPQGGSFDWTPPQELILKGGGRLGVRVTAGVSVSAVARILGEE